ncbi:MAG: VWA domain-containing protein [Bacteroidetes bacterium]|nr:MAG: VWA domain-containing protein [Bacteroidota bacterium]
MLVAELSFSLQGNLFLVFLLMLIGIGLAVLFYRYTLPPLPPARRIVLSSLRSLILCALLLLFFEPILRLIQRDMQAPGVAVLVDNSQSMTLTDGATLRGEAVRQFLKSEPLKNFASTSETRTYAFSSTLPKATLESPDSLHFTGETTNLFEAIKQLRTRLVPENIQAVVLVSDGNFTVGKNPLYDAEELGIPLFTVGVGDTVEQKDLLVEKVVTNTIAYAETRLPVEVTIKSSGFGGENVEVTMREGATILDRKVIMLEHGVREFPLRLTVEPREEGTRKYTITVSELPGELTTKNNVQSVFVKVLKSKLRVLLLAGAPNPDVAAVRQALLKEQHFTVSARIQKNGQEFYEGRVTQALLDSADCFVLIGFPSRGTPSQIIQQVKAGIAERKKPLLFINAKTTDYQKLGQLEPELPFSWSGINPSELSIFATIPDKQKTNTLVHLGGSVTSETWGEMPPIYKSHTSFRLKPESELLASVRIQNVVLPEPLLAIRSINRIKSFAITGYGIWRWQLLADENNEQSALFQELLVNAVRWLTTKDEGKNLRVTPTKESFTTAEPLEFTAQLYDEQFRPIDDAEVTLVMQNGTATKEIALNAMGNGMFEGAGESIGEGDYTFTAKAETDGRTLGADNGKFTVGLMNVEFLETKMNKPLLEQLAYRTNGKYYHISSAQQLADDIKSSAQFTTKEVVQSSEIELWNWHYLAGIIILLLAVEWFLRKQSGMI